jgi:hypothetical protein
MDILNIPYLPDHVELKGQEAPWCNYTFFMQIFISRWQGEVFCLFKLATLLAILNFTSFRSIPYVSVYKTIFWYPGGHLEFTCVTILIFLRRKVPGQTGARTRDPRQHRPELNTNALTLWARSPFLKRMVLWIVAFRHDTKANPGEPLCTQCFFKHCISILFRVG